MLTERLFGKAPGPQRAYLIQVRPPSASRVPLTFNPTEFQIAKNNTFAEIPVPGLARPPLQFVRGGSETLSLEALLDTSDTLDDVETRYVSLLRGLMEVDGREHAPPVVELRWGPSRSKKQDQLTVFHGVLASLSVTYTLFDPSGKPLRARASMSMTGFPNIERDVLTKPFGSPTVDKTYVVRRGDSLPAIAQAMYRDPGRWRELARANGITDPRALAPGQVLAVPPLEAP